MVTTSINSNRCCRCSYCNSYSVTSDISNCYCQLVNCSISSCSCHWNIRIYNWFLYNQPPPSHAINVMRLRLQLPWQISIHGSKKNAFLGGRDILRRRPILNQLYHELEKVYKLQDYMQVVHRSNNHIQNKSLSNNAC